MDQSDTVIGPRQCANAEKDVQWRRWSWWNLHASTRALGIGWSASVNPEHALPAHGILERVILCNSSNSFALCECDPSPSIVVFTLVLATVRPLRPPLAQAAQLVPTAVLQVASGRVSSVPSCCPAIESTFSIWAGAIIITSAFPFLDRLSPPFPPQCLHFACKDLLSDSVVAFLFPPIDHLAAIWMAIKLNQTNAHNAN